MNTSSLPGLYPPATNNSTSTLRPRTGRLISYLDDDGSDSGRNDSIAISTSAASTPPRLHSRGVSPNAAVNTSKAADRSRQDGRDTPHAGSSSTSHPPAGGRHAVWEPWSSLQGFASTLLGDVPAPTKDKPTGSFKTPLWMKQDKRYGVKSSAMQWGPIHALPTDIVGETAEERKDLVQAKKREALLASASENRDSLGRFKRRDSNTVAPSSPTESREFALVYLHKVQPGDTLAGVIIKYNCQADRFRKINRFWPNDNIQTRTHVLIPLEESTTRGTKVESPHLSNDLFDTAQNDRTARESAASEPVGSEPLSVNGMYPSPRPIPADAASSRSPKPLSLISSLHEEVEFQHDAWVMLPNFKEAIEVLRVPRRALGYFPRPRRKSNATLTDTSTASTPKSSFDMLRHPPTHAAQLSASLSASPVRQPGMPLVRPGITGRQRSSSITTSGGGTFVDALRGPGGVGTLRGLRTDASRPGPAEDSLNRKFAQYFPDFLPPPKDVPRTGLGGWSSATRSTPRASFDSVRSTRSNSNSAGLPGDVGGTLEGWVRKMAGATTKRDRNAAVDKMGDLIELETNADPARPGDWNLRAAEVEDADMGSIPQATTPTLVGGSNLKVSVTATSELSVNERFPARGRLRNTYSSSSDMGKNKAD